MQYINLNNCKSAMTTTFCFLYRKMCIKCSCVFILVGKIMLVNQLLYSHYFIAIVIYI